MSPQVSDDWPGGDHTTRCPPDHVHAIGQITLSFNQLEIAVRMLLEQTLTLPNEAARKIIRDMSNRERVDTLRLMIEATPHKAYVRTALMNALTAFDICAENRNIIVHASHLASDPSTGTTTFSKMASGGPVREVFYVLDLERLREVGDAMTVTYQYMALIWVHLEALNPNPPPEEGGQKSWWWRAPPKLTPLPDTPAKPRKLIPTQPPAIPQDEAPQPQS